MSKPDDWALCDGEEVADGRLLAPGEEAAVPESKKPSRRKAQ